MLTRICEIAYVANLIQTHAQYAGTSNGNTSCKQNCKLIKNQKPIFHMQLWRHSSKSGSAIHHFIFLADGCFWSRWNLQQVVVYFSFFSRWFTFSHNISNESSKPKECLYIVNCRAVRFINTNTLDL